MTMNVDFDSDIDKLGLSSWGQQIAVAGSEPELKLADETIVRSISRQGWMPSVYGAREMPLQTHGYQKAFRDETTEQVASVAQKTALPASVDPAPKPERDDPKTFAMAKGILNRAFAPRSSLTMEMARGAREYSGLFAELQRLRDDKVQKLKDELPKIYGNLSSSMNYQKWLDLICGFASGGSQIGSTMTAEKTLFHGIMKGLGEGGAVRGIQSFIDAGCQADQTGMHGKKSEKESQREAMVQGGNSADQAFQSFLQIIKDIHQIEQQMGIR